MRQEILLGMLVKEPAHGYQLQSRLQAALGALAMPDGAGQVYVTLRRLETAGLVTPVDDPAPPSAGDRQDRKAYALTEAGRRRVDDWLADVSWPKPDLADFHLKLVVAARSRLADPLVVIDAQRRALMRRLRDAQAALVAAPADSEGALLLEGVVLRTTADLRWLESCEARWSVAP